jgi:hypothetical protein
MSAFEIKTHPHVTKLTVMGTWSTFPGTLSNTGVLADPDGRKIVYSGTPLKSGGTGTIRANRDVAVCVREGDGLLAETVLYEDVDVTDGSKPATFLLRGTINGSNLPRIPSASGTALNLRYPHHRHIFRASGSFPDVRLR